MISFAHWCGPGHARGHESKAVFTCAPFCLQEEKTDRFKSCITFATIHLGDGQSSPVFKQALSRLLPLLLHSHAVLDAVRGLHNRSRDGLEIASRSRSSEDVASVHHDRDMLAAFLSSQLQSTPLTLATSALGQSFKNFFATAFDQALSPVPYADFVVPERYQGWVDTQHKPSPHLKSSHCIRLSIGVSLLPEVSRFSLSRAPRATTAMTIGMTTILHCIALHCIALHLRVIPVQNWALLSGNLSVTYTN
ncbi:hypothetical protein BDV97DRAFT_65387 [Delphinella strobiligena]|nr:hypothetical protein BDV97DRAFT_65387 [Delphinella strobiligena]